MALSTDQVKADQPPASPPVAPIGEVADHIERIARTCHEVNRVVCRAMGDQSQERWEKAPDWQRESVLAGVKAALADPGRTPRESHEAWMARRRAAGWAYGPVKDIEKKLHPCMQPYDVLPAAQKLKDNLFLTVVRMLAQG